MTINEKIDEIRKLFCGGDNKKFAEMLGFSPQYASNICKEGKSVGESQKMHILSVFPSISKSWLFADEGEMLKQVEESETRIEKKENQVATGKLIPFYDVDAAAGSCYEMNMSSASHPTGMIEIGSILRDSQSAIRVYGNSMIPNYPAGCVIGLKLHLDSFIEPGHVYVIETRENRYIKRLYYNDDKTCFHCLSDNQMKYEDGPRKGKLYYQDFEIPIEEVIRLHQVVGVIKRNIL